MDLFKMLFINFKKLIPFGNSEKKKKNIRTPNARASIQMLRFSKAESGTGMSVYPRLGWVAWSKGFCGVGSVFGFFGWRIDVMAISAAKFM